MAKSIHDGTPLSSCGVPRFEATRDRGCDVDDKVLEELEFHQETVATDANSPLHLIREKEMEISGRVLAAKQEAEEIVARARKQAVETVAEGRERR